MVFFVPVPAATMFRTKLLLMRMRLQAAGNKDRHGSYIYVYWTELITISYCPFLALNEWRFSSCWALHIHNSLESQRNLAQNKELGCKRAMPPKCGIDAITADLARTGQLRTPTESNFYDPLRFLHQVTLRAPKAQDGRVGPTLLCGGAEAVLR